MPGTLPAPVPRLISRTALTAYQSAWLDWARGLSAVAVLIYHVRYRFFADWSEVSHSVGNLVFYTVTSFGHDAVMVFFVLSGLLISRSIFRAQGEGRWRWSRYLLARSVRLYVVLLPGLLLTFAWDWTGLSLFPDHVIYTGHDTPWWNDFFDVRGRLGFDVLLGNLFFLQSVVMPPYGSNEPLWSLSYEFWYYIVFPLVWVPLVAPGRPLWRIGSVVAGLALISAVGPTITTYFPLWLIGTALWFAPRSAVVARTPRFYGVIGALVFAGTLVACHTVLAAYPVTVRDYLIGLAFASFVYVVLHDQRELHPSAATRLGGALADQSYTLYLGHVPLLVFCRAWLGSEAGQWQPGGLTLLYACGLTVVALVYAFGLARITEHHTEAFRSRLHAWLWRPPARAFVPEVAGGDVAAYARAAQRSRVAERS